MKRAAALTVLVAMIFSVMTAIFPAQSQAQDETTITILHNNDGESNLLPDDEGGDPGIARFVTALKQLQADGPGDEEDDEIGREDVLRQPKVSRGPHPFARWAHGRSAPPLPTASLAEQS